MLLIYAKALKDGVAKEKKNKTKKTTKLSKIHAHTLFVTTWNLLFQNYAVVLGKQNHLRRHTLPKKIYSQDFISSVTVPTAIQTENSFPFL